MQQQQQSPPLSYKRYIKERMCTNKQRYDTVDEAIEVAFNMSQKYNKVCAPYKCKYGDHYHLTTRVHSKIYESEGKNVQKAH